MIRCAERWVSSLLPWRQLPSAACCSWRPVDRICSRFVQQNPQVYRPGSGFTAATPGVREELTRNAKPMLLVQRTIEVLGAIDIVVNNAGATKRGDFLILGEDDWTHGFALKFFGAVRLTVSDESGTFSAWLMTSRRGMRGC